MTLERLRELLETYGAAEPRWPDAEREAARRLIAESTAARALRDAAADLDRLLDALPAEAPSAALAARVLAAAPRPARRWRAVLAAAAPLAAAAAAVVWLAIRHEPVAHRAADASAALALGEYTSPTDVLLTPYGVDVYATVPAIGCADSTLGCPKVPDAGRPYSQRWPTRRSLA